jgi:hypothetical protein
MSYLINEFFQDDNEDNDNDFQIQLKQESIEIFTKDDFYFTLNEVENIIYELKPNKAPGIDKITNEIQNVSST